MKKYKEGIYIQFPENRYKVIYIQRLPNLTRIHTYNRICILLTITPKRQMSKGYTVNLAEKLSEGLQMGGKKIVNS